VDGQKVPTNISVSRMQSVILVDVIDLVVTSVVVSVMQLTFLNSVSVISDVVLPIVQSNVSIVMLDLLCADETAITVNTSGELRRCGMFVTDSWVHLSDSETVSLRRRRLAHWGDDYDRGKKQRRTFHPYS
jgi:hypothetical protein